MTDVLPFVITGVVTGSLYGLAGIGLVLTYRTSGVFNFGHGAIAAGGAFVFYTLHDTHGVPWPVAVVVTLLVFGVGVGWVLERITRSLGDAPEAVGVVVTVGLALGVQGILFWRYGNVTRYLPEFLPATGFTVLDVNIAWSQVISVSVATISALGLYGFLRHARLGVAMRAVVDNPALLGLTGEMPARVRTAAWAIGSSFAALSGMLLAPTLGLDATLLTLLVIQAFGACAIGRFTSLPMTYVGGLIVGVSASVATRYFTERPWSAVPATMPFLILVAVLLVVPVAKLPKRQGGARSLMPDAPAISPRAGILVAVAGIGLLIVAPWHVGTYLPVWTAGLVAVIIYLSLGLVVWTSGQISLCHAAFLALGATTMGHLSHGAGLPWLLSLLVAGLLTVPVGALVAIPAIRLSGLYLALATLGFGFMLQNMFYPASFMFGAGTPVVVSRPQLGFLDGTDDRAFYYVVLAVAVASVIAIAGVARSRLGRLLRAMAESPTLLTTHGLGVNMTRLIVFCISAFFAGIAGALQVTQFGSASGSTYTPIHSLMFLAVLAIAGTRLISSAVIAATLIAVLPAYAASQDGAAFADDTDRQLLFFGLIAIAAGIRIAKRADLAFWLSGRAAIGRDRLSRSRRPRPQRLRRAVDDEPHGHGDVVGWTPELSPTQSVGR